MKNRTLLISIVILTIFSLVSCKKQDDTAGPQVHSYIQGVVTIEGDAVSGAYVQFDNNVKNVSITNAYGKFEIFNVTPGDHSIKIQKVLENGSSIEYNLSRNIGNETVNLGEIRFSKAPVVYIDTISVLNSVKIKWNITTEKAFKEYAVYRRNSSDVTDANGTLVYKSANSTDTSFIDNSLAKGTTAYYRIYVYSTSGKIYGSTIEGVNAPPKNYVTNGSFESAGFGQRPESWVYVMQGLGNYEYFKMTSSTVKEGKLSLQINWTDSVANYSHQSTLYQRIQTNRMESGKTYKFSFWAKSDTGQIGIYLYLGDKMNYFSIPGKQDWTEKSFTFQMDKSIESMRIEIISSGDFGRLVKGWIDDVKIAEVK